jgi:hypothetical protein
VLQLRSGTCSPSGEQRAQIDSVDLSVAAEITGSGASPVGEQHAEVDSIDGTVVREISAALRLAFDGADGKLVDAGLGDGVLWAVRD